MKALMKALCLVTIVLACSLGARADKSRILTFLKMEALDHEYNPGAVTSFSRNTGISRKEIYSEIEASARSRMAGSEALSKAVHRELEVALLWLGSSGDKGHAGTLAFASTNAVAPDLRMTGFLGYATLEGAGALALAERLLAEEFSSDEIGRLRVYRALRDRVLGNLDISPQDAALVVGFLRARIGIETEPSCIRIIDGTLASKQVGYAKSQFRTQLVEEVQKTAKGASKTYFGRIGHELTGGVEQPQKPPNGTVTNTSNGSGILPDQSGIGATSVVHRPSRELEAGNPEGKRPITKWVLWGLVLISICLAFIALKKRGRDTS